MSSQGGSLRLDEVESTVHGDSTELILASNKLKRSRSITISSCTTALRSVNADTHGLLCVHFRGIGGLRRPDVRVS
jgi:hypothetical protein